MLTKLKDHIIDSLVVGGINANSPYKLLPLLHHPKEQIKTRYKIGSTYSISQCSVTDAPFNSDGFRDTNPTPGTKNDCGVMNDNNPPLKEALAQLKKIENLVTNDENAFEVARDVTLPVLERGDSAQKTCPLLEDVGRASGEQALNLRREYARKDRLLDPNADPFTQPLEDHTHTVHEWEKPYMKDSDWLNLESFQSDLWPINTMKEKYKWSQLVLNETDPAQSRIRCGMCNKFSKAARIRPQEMSDISKDEGILFPEKRYNLRALQRHAKGSQHNGIEQWLKNLAEQNIKEDDYPMAIMKNAEGYPNDTVYDEYTVTARMLRTVYLESKLNVPYTSHQDVVNLQKLNSINMGYHHYTKTSAKQMLDLISGEMHKRLMAKIQNEDNPISIILDDRDFRFSHIFLNHIFLYLSYLQYLQLGIHL